jgi:hypothetical protein
VTLRLDSCADITLVSQAFYERMSACPKLGKGMKVKLWQLTDRNSEIAGSVVLPVIMRTNNRQLIEMEAKVYVVPNMTMDVLLGEDFQRNFGISPLRDGDEQPRIGFAGHDFTVDADAVGATKDAGRVKRSVLSARKVEKAKTHRKSRRTKDQRRRGIARKGHLVWASAEYTIAAESVRNVKVSAAFGEDTDKEWLVERSLFADISGRGLMVPPTLLTGGVPYLAVANMSKFPRTIKRGDVHGVLSKPGLYFDTPALDNDKTRMHQHVSEVAVFIASRLDGTGLNPPSSEVHPAAESRAAAYGASKDLVSEPDKQYGPKTAEILDDQTYNAAQLREILDVGEVPEHL